MNLLNRRGMDSFSAFALLTRTRAIALKAFGIMSRMHYGLKGLNTHSPGLARLAGGPSLGHGNHRIDRYPVRGYIADGGLCIPFGESSRRWANPG